MLSINCSKDLKKYFLLFSKIFSIYFHCNKIIFWHFWTCSHVNLIKYYIAVHTLLYASCCQFGMTEINLWKAHTNILKNSFIKFQIFALRQYYIIWYTKEKKTKICMHNMSHILNNNYFVYKQTCFSHSSFVLVKYIKYHMAKCRKQFDYYL